MPPLLKKYQQVQKKKRSYCAGKATKADVKRAATVYVTAAVAKGQTKSEAQKKVDRIMKSGCSMTANIAGKKRKAATTRKRKPASTAKRGTAARRPRAKR